MVLHDSRDVTLILGAPGAGKGTQATALAEALGVPHIASGDLLRDHRTRGTDLGHAAQVYMDRGDLVPDDLVIDMIMERLSAPDATHGALLDGFPRTLPQAEALDRRLKEKGSDVTRALYLEVPTDVLINRLAGRWMCRDCQTPYHEVFNPSPAGQRCGNCGGELYQRPDDTREVVTNRIEVYLRDTLPVIQHYADVGVLRRVDGNRSIEAVQSDLLAAAGADAAPMPA